MFYIVEFHPFLSFFLFSFSFFFLPEFSRLKFLGTGVNDTERTRMYIYIYTYKGRVFLAVRERDASYYEGVHEDPG